MRIDLHAKVRTRDGADVGRLAHALFDPDKREITGVVVKTGDLFGDDVAVPRGEIERATVDGDVLALQLTKDEFGRLERFEPARYQQAPVGWMPPPGGIAWGIPTDAYLWAEPAAAADLPPHVDKGSPVLDRDGEEVGVVEDVDIAPDSGRVERFTVKLGGALGRLFGQAKAIDLSPDDIARIEDGTVRLARDKDEIAAR